MTVICQFSKSYVQHLQNSVQSANQTHGKQADAYIWSGGAGIVQGFE